MLNRTGIDAVKSVFGNTLQEFKVKIIPGIYFLFDNGELCYIGKSVDMNSRLNTHIKSPQKDFGETYAIPIEIKDPSDLDYYEKTLIRYFRPRYNKEYNDSVVVSDQEVCDCICTLKEKVARPTDNETVKRVIDSTFRSEYEKTVAPLKKEYERLRQKVFRAKKKLAAYRSGIKNLKG